MRVRNEYDGFSNLRKLARLKDSLEVIHEFNVDKLDRVLSAIDPLLRETEVAHEPFCLERTVTTPRGIETHYRFDSLCRLHQVESQRELVIYSYDELGRLVSVSQDSHYRYMQDPSRYVRLSYIEHPKSARNLRTAGTSTTEDVLCQQDQIDPGCIRQSSVKRHSN